MRESFSVRAIGGELGGWREGEGTPVVLLHGGPGLGYEYLDEVAADIVDGYRIAAFQQRGLSPSTTDGPFTMAQAIADVVAVLDGLRLHRAILVGHSWGGHLALRFAAAHPERLLGAPSSIRSGSSATVGSRRSRPRWRRGRRSPPAPG